MNRMFIYYILCSVSFLWTFECTETQRQIEASFREGLEIYLETGRRTAQLNDTIKELQLPNLFRSTENKAFSQAACIVCHAGVGVIIAARRIGFTKEVLINLLENLCVWLNIESETVCHGVITINADSLIYIIDHRKTLTSGRVCSILMQMYDCVDPGRKDWVLNIPEPNRTHLKSKPKEPKNSFKIIHISDVHYDPEYEIGSKGGCKEPLCCQKSSQPSNVQDAAGYWGDYRNCDMPWHTITDSLNHIATQHKDADFVYFTGDVINHKVWDTNVTENMRAMTMVFRQLNQTFGSTPVYPILGNHEPHPVNLFSSDNVNEPHLTTQWVFDLVAKEWKMWLPPETDETLLKGGYYTTLIKKGLRLIGLNSNVCYTFNWWLFYDDFDPYGQLRWLIRTLLQAEENNEFVHILSHIPNGDNTCLENWSREYAKIINRFSHIIAAQFNGHTHNDRTLIFFNQSDPSHAINVAFDCGSLTTYSNLNPNYKVFEVADITGEVLDFESWTFNLTQANLNHKRSPDWYKLYSFKEAYGVENLSPKDILQLTERIAKIPKLSQLYFRNKIRDADPELLKGCDKDCEINNLCEMVTSEAGDMFVAHSNVQQLLASIWYEGLPGFRRKNMVLQALEIVRIGILFPFFSVGYVLAPHSVIGKTMRKPFIKFICNSASYFVFLFMLILASQRIETLFFDEEPEDFPTKRGAKPSLVEWIILAWVSGLIWSEIKQLWDVGLEEYARDMWNVIDFITNSLYVATVALRVVSYYQVQRNPKSETIKREDWDAWDPMLISEGLFSAANIFSSLKLVYIFSVNPHLGPLQVSLSRMVMDIIKFFFLYVLVLFAFSCGLNQLLWYYADAERLKCPTEVSKPVYAEIILEPKTPNRSKLPNCTMSEVATDSNACTIWRRFANLFETSQTLFWAVFGLVDLESFELSGIKIFTRFWGMLMFGTYSVINIVVLLNLLIAMMNHSYQLISERADVEWKFARSKLWISYFEEGGTVPPPFNIIPTPKSAWYVIEWLRRKLCGHSKAAKKEHMRTIRKKVKQASERDFRYQSIMRNLVRRYVTVEQRKAENQGVTEDDVNEIKQDISAFRFELIEILKNSGMNTSTAQSGMGTGTGGKKNRQKERRLMKGFNIGPQPSTTTAPLPPVAEFIASLQHHHDGQQHDLFGSTLSGIFNSAPRKIHQQSTVSSSQGSINEGQYHHHHHHRGLSKYENWFHTKRASSHKRRWGTLIEAAKAGKVSRLIGRSRSEDSVCNSHCRENGHNHSHSHSNSPASDENGSVSPSDSNPSLDIVPPELPPPPEDHHHGLTSGLLLLKKKRKKFSASRNASPIVIPTHNVVEHPRHATGNKTNKKVLQRASSVPVRVSEVVQFSKHNLEQTQSEQDSVDIPTTIASTLTPSTTEESVVTTAGQSALPTGTSSREPLLYNSSSSTQATGSSQTPEDEYKQNSQYYTKLPGIIPISGHNGQTGWL